MRETTIRRMLVLALCIGGVVALWVIADQVAFHSDRSATDRPTGRNTGVVSPAGRSSDQRTGDPAASDPSGISAEPTGLDEQPRTTGPSADHDPPPTVPGLHVISATYDAITVGWDDVSDPSGIAHYLVTLNGISAGETGGRQLTVNWFNDDMSSHFIQVWAVDGAGNRSPRGEPVMVSRPASPGPSTDWPGPGRAADQRDDRTAGPSDQPARPDRRHSPTTAATSPTARPAQSQPVQSEPVQSEPAQSEPAGSAAPESQPAEGSAAPSRSPAGPSVDPRRSQTPIATPTPEPTETGTASPTPSPTPTGSPSPTPTDSADPTPTDQPTAGDNLVPAQPDDGGTQPSDPPSPSEASSPSPTPSDSPSPQAGRLESSTASPSPSAQPSRSSR